MKQPDLKGLSEQQLKYVTYLEGCLYGASDLLSELNLISKSIADELSKLRGEGTLLSNDENFDKVMSIIDKSPKLKALISFTRKEEDEATEPEKIPLRNISDLAKKRSAG